jgi:hypothetical protein
MLEKNGVGIAAISYDSQETLRDFADKHAIGFPLLSDRDSRVICRFGIFNSNIAPDLRAHGVPHPVSFLVTPDGLLLRKYFVDNYQHRVTGAAIVLREFGGVDLDAPVTIIRSGALSAEIGLSSSKAFAGQEISLLARFELEPGWHIYGTPLPAAYTPTSITFDDPKIISQSFELPGASQTFVVALDETLPVHAGSFRGLGSLLLRFPIDAGQTVLSGTLSFQQCSDMVCEPPQSISFALPLTIEVFIDAERKKYPSHFRPSRHCVGP